MISCQSAIVYSSILYHYHVIRHQIYCDV